MNLSATNIAFGPVPSRRLGRSLGINHVPPKTCTYACVYCQLGQTSRMQIARQAFYTPEMIAAAVGAKLATLAQSGEQVDYLTLVPDGEPTLDAHLGEILAQLKPFGIPLAVITNASLTSEPSVRDALMRADWVSLKVDAADEAPWQQINRPHGRLELADILARAQAFARAFQGILVTETMLVAGVNDDPDTVETTAAAIARSQPSVAYLSIPTRPPAEAWVHPPNEASLNRAYQIYAAALPRVELLIGYEGNAFAASGDAATDLLSITAVHPMRAEAVAHLLASCGATRDVVDDLVRRGALVPSTYDQHTFYLRGYHARENRDGD